MYGDTEVMRKHVARLREQGQDIRALAEQLVAQAEAVTWSGVAGDAMRERVREQATRLREVAERHESAAHALDAHGQLVDELKDAIAEAERRASALLDDAELAQLEPPAPGHKDWLALTLPGAEGRG